MTYHYFKILLTLVTLLLCSINFSASILAQENKIISGRWETIRRKIETIQVQASEHTENSPYGICAHIAGPNGQEALSQKLELIRSAGIHWVRCDFSGWDVEGPRGVWKFEHLDNLLNECEKYGINVLPILNHPHGHAYPTYEKLEEWLIYVEKVVSRYKDRIRYWEVYNEPNLQGFGDGNNDERGKNYTKTLIATYKKIKEIDPHLTVLYGGLSYIPLDFIESSFQEGSASFFDIMNVHSYCSGFTSMGRLEEFETTFIKLHELMQKFNVDNKGIWITEMGWATIKEPFYVSRGIVSAAKEILASEPQTWKIAVLSDGNYPAATASFDVLRKLCPDGCEACEIKLPDLVDIDPKKYQALIFPPSEMYPYPYHDDILRYVTQGGNLFLLGGVPMGHTMNFKDGTPAPDKLLAAKKIPQPLIFDKEWVASQESINSLRIGWEAFWFAPVPKECDIVFVDEYKKYMQKYADAQILPKTSARFLHDKNLKNGDRMISLLDAVKDDYKAPCVAIYDFNSDMKGAVIVSTLFIEWWEACTLYEQSYYLPQAILLTQRFGADKFFWYVFQNGGDDSLQSRYNSECHFGIVDRNLTPKPSYHAYTALTKVCPGGSVIDKNLPWKRGETALVSWTCPNKVRGWAIWSPCGKREISVKIDGRVDSVTDCYGNEIKLPQRIVKNKDSANTNLILNRAPIYILGPNKIEIH